MKIYIESLGCAKNQVDSEILLTYAEENGYERTDDPASADVIVVNTCGFIESAKTESIDAFFSLREAYPDARIILDGCIAERYGREMELEEAAGKFSYPLETKRLMFRTVYDSFSPLFHNNVFFYLCMEDPSLWPEVLGREYSCDKAFEEDMKRSYMAKMRKR